MVQVLHGQENAALAHIVLEFNTEVKDESPSHKLCGRYDPTLSFRLWSPLHTQPQLCA